MALENLPGIGPYLAVRDMNQQAGLRDVQSMSALSGLLENMDTAPIKRDLLRAQADLYAQHAKLYPAQTAVLIQKEQAAAENQAKQNAIFQYAIDQMRSRSGGGAGGISPPGTPQGGQQPLPGILTVGQGGTMATDYPFMAGNTIPVGRPQGAGDPLSGITPAPNLAPTGGGQMVFDAPTLQLLGAAGFPNVGNMINAYKAGNDIKTVQGGSWAFSPDGRREYMPSVPTLPELLQRREAAKKIQDETGGQNAGVAEIDALIKNFHPQAWEVINRTQTPGPTVNGLATPGSEPDRKVQALINKEWIEKIDNPIQEGGRLAPNEISVIKLTRSQLARVGDTSWSKPAQVWAARVLNGLGMASDEAVKAASAAETFRATGMQKVLALQLEQRGVQSEPDARRMEQTYASLANTPEANAFILDSLEATAQMKMVRAAFYRKAKMLPQYRGNLQSVDDAWQEETRNFTIFDMPTMRRYKQ